jgi:hypothetical protein
MKYRMSKIISHFFEKYSPESIKVISKTTIIMPSVLRLNPVISNISINEPNIITDINTNSFEFCLFWT